MKEKILDIAEVRDIPTDKCARADGFKIVTTKRTLQILIDNSQCCCENWGYMHTPDNVNHIIGAELYELKNISTEIADRKLKSLNLYEPDTYAQFITLFTSKGEVTFTVYNEHNGYYSHGAYIIENGVVTKEDSL